MTNFYVYIRNSVFKIIPSYIYSRRHETVAHLLHACSPESESYVMTDGQPASLSWNKAPFWGLLPDLYYCLTVAGFLIWGALSDKRTSLSFAIATGPRQRSHFRIRVP
jgi:hypothetical protein